MGQKQAFIDAGAPLKNFLNQWSALAPDESFIVITVWEHEYDDPRLRSSNPALGPVRPGAAAYFRNTPEYIAEWAEERRKAGRRPPRSVPGWTVLQRHLALADERGLPVKVVFISAKNHADGSVRAKIKCADFRSSWHLELTYHDRVTGAYELAIFDTSDRTPDRPANRSP